VHIRHWTKRDEFCLTWDERVRLAERLAEMAALNEALDSELRRLLEQTVGEANRNANTSTIDALVVRSRAVLERVFLERGEVFASAVSKSTGILVPYVDIEAVVYRDMAVQAGSRQAEPRFIITALQALLLEPTEDIHTYLRSLSDTYTLFAFMRETPDVQSSFLKIFSDADIWLDTNVEGEFALLAFLFAHPDSHAIRLLDYRGDYFDVRSGNTWDLFFPGYYIQIRSDTALRTRNWSATRRPRVCERLVLQRARLRPVAPPH